MRITYVENKLWKKKKKEKKKKTCPIRPRGGAGRRGPCGRLERPHTEMVLRYEE
jgi:hypothetical protein